jgi:hypothetical protein
MVSEQGTDNQTVVCFNNQILFLALCPIDKPQFVPMILEQVGGFI